MAAALAKRMRCEAVLPRYPLAPEEPFPAAIDALTGAYRALIARVPRGRVTVAGDSAGGCLTLALLGSLPAAEQPGAAVAISPVVDLSGTGGTLDAHAAGDVLLPRGRFDEMRGMYLGEHPVTDPRASPVHAVFNAPPPVLFHVSAGEMLFGDTKRMVAALTAQGHEPAVQIWPNAFHVFHLMQGIVPEAAAAMDHIATFIDRCVPPTGS
ncbi:MAG: alpha/beta hydrolase, partial [Pseudomonadota bacterium]